MNSARAWNLSANLAASPTNDPRPTHHRPHRLADRQGHRMAGLPTDAWAGIGETVLAREQVMSNEPRQMNPLGMS